jgi:ATP phosphoribosyltransferase regulatory subunit
MSTIAETVEKFDALEAQAQRLMAVFATAGCEPVAPAIIQPANLMLDVVGEDLRARTYVFADADGVELCLRPDLTVPTCRLYLERHPEGTDVARYCYNGPAFRYRPLDSPKGNPREFRQAGIESFCVADREAADAEIVGLTAAAVRDAGLQSMRVRMGDIGLLSALLDGIDMPDRWRRRLRHQFWRPDAFRAELKRLTSAPDAAARRLPGRLANEIDPSNLADAEQRVGDHLDAAGIELTANRSLREITEGVVAAIADARAAPLDSDDANLIESYVAITTPAEHAAERLAALLRRPKLDISTALDAFERRLGLMEAAGVDVAAAEFSGDFGRKFEYYTGFVFELEATDLGRNNPVAGGGRYDSLLEIIGAPRRVPAVGAAIYTERLLLIQQPDAAGRAS